MGPLSFRRSPANGTRWTPLCFTARGCLVSFDPSHDLAGGDAQVLTDRRARVSTDYSPVMILLTVIAALGVLLYSSFLLNPANRGDWLPYSMVIVAESLLIVQALLAMWTILSGASSPRDYAYYAARDALFDPTWIARNGKDATKWPFRLNGNDTLVDVFITVYGEPVDTIRRTATAARAMNGKHRTWILDDGKSDEVRDLAAELGCHYVRRLSNNGAKAGNINHALSIAKGEYFAILDADFVPKEDFLVETLPYTCGVWTNATSSLTKNGSVSTRKSTLGTKSASKIAKYSPLARVRA